jgi:hypothetical protein
MTRIESATERLHIAIESLVTAITETCVNDGTMSFRDADKIANMTLAESITQIGIVSFTEGLKAGIEQHKNTINQQVVYNPNR